MISLTGKFSMFRSVQKVRRNVPSSRGLTLIEVLVAVVLLSVGTIMGLQGLATISRALSRMESQSAAYEFAVNKMTELESRALHSTKLEEFEKLEEGTFQAAQRSFAWVTSWTVPDPDVSLGSIRLTVSWQHGEARYESQFSTLINLPKSEE